MTRELILSTVKLVPNPVVPATALKFVLPAVLIVVLKTLDNCMDSYMAAVLATILTSLVKLHWQLCWKHVWTFLTKFQCSECLPLNSLVSWSLHKYCFFKPSTISLRRMTFMPVRALNTFYHGASYLDWKLS